ncbi:MAG: hypothetical protein ACOCVA_06005 [Prolixibacteraceae bacterium]
MKHPVTLKQQPLSALQPGKQDQIPGRTTMLETGKQINPEYL